MSKDEISKIIREYERKGIRSREILNLIEEDLERGIPKEQVALYAGNISMDNARKKVYSTCLRKGFEPEVIEIIIDKKLNTEQMNSAVEFYDRGITKEELREIIDKGSASPMEMSKLFRKVIDSYRVVKDSTEGESEMVTQFAEDLKKVLEKMSKNEELMEAMQEKISKAENQISDGEREKLLKEIQDKDMLLSDQQDKINAANAEIMKVKQELRKIREENSNMRKEVERIAEKSEERIQNYSPPVSYNVITEQGINVTTEKTSTGSIKAAKALIRKMFFTRKSGKDLVKMVIEGDLDTDQLAQIMKGISKGLTESQLEALINSGKSAEKMAGIIEIAVLENAME